MSEPHPEIERLRRRLDALPGVEAVRAATAGAGAHLVGGAVRDLLLGRERADLDLVVEGDAIALARRLGEHPVVHERFGTATVTLDGVTVDVATARAESYPAPGALPVVRAGTLAEDLARRDFTINAMAVPLEGEPELLDPHGGLGDLEAGILRVLHEGSFADDPTRALRAARYAARLGLAPSAETERLLRAADLDAVSADRIDAELGRVGAEPDPAAVLTSAAQWGLLALDPSSIDLAREALARRSYPEWKRLCSAAEVVKAIARNRLQRARELAASAPPGPAAAVKSARGHDPVDLALARALGAEWLDSYLREWRWVRLAIGGTDLIAAGVAEGPEIGRGLQAALRAKLDGDVAGREQELQVALEAARA